MLLAPYLLVLVVVLFAPTSGVQSGLVRDLVDVLHRLGASGSVVTYGRAEVIMNAVIIAPVSFLGAFVLTRLRWQDWTAYAFLGAGAVELLQGVLLPDRTASFGDIVANASGACLGALLQRGLRRTSHPAPGSR